MTAHALLNIRWSFASRLLFLVVLPADIDTLIRLWTSEPFAVVAVCAFCASYLCCKARLTGRGKVVKLVLWLAKSRAVYIVLCIRQRAIASGTLLD
jgi:uncharacterized membrane protein